MAQENKITFLPFDLYDLFGYLMPSIILISLIILGVWYQNDFYVNEKHVELFSKYVVNTQWWLGVVYLSIIATFLYLIGHIIASLSSIIIDKFIVDKIIGYPYLSLLRTSSDYEFFANVEKKDNSKNYYKTIVFYSLIIFVYNAFSEVSANVAKCFIFIYVLLFFIKLLISIKKDKIKKLKLIYSKKRENKCMNLFYNIIYLMIKLYSIIVNVISFISNNLFLIISKPFNVIFYFFGNFFSLRKRFEDDFVVEFKKTYTNTFHLKDVLSTTTYWLCYTRLLNYSPHSASLLKNWLRLYSLMRNLSMVFLILSLFFLYLRHFNLKVDIEKFSLLPLISLLTSAFFFVRFYYLYYTYYSKYLFRSFYEYTVRKDEDLNENKES